jgi:hypothetical protein
MGSVRWAEAPEVTSSTHDGHVGRVGNVIGFVVRAIVSLETQDPLLDLAVVEAKALDVESEVDVGQDLEILAKESIIPRTEFGETVVCDHQASDLLLAQVDDTQGRNPFYTDQLACLDACVTADQTRTLIDHDRDPESEGANAFGNLSDLFLGVETGIVGVWVK